MRIGILLGGCGLYDGSDVQETVLVVQALDAAGERPVFLAPERPQLRTVDHRTGAATTETRGVLPESARLARGPVRSLAEARAEDLEGLIIPGGYGPAINFGTGFAVQGATRALHPEVAAFLRHFVETGKPIGMVGLGEAPIRLLLGEDLPPPKAGAGSDGLRIDEGRALLATPGFAGFSRLVEVREGIEALVGEVLRRVDARAGAGEAASARGEGGA